MKQNTQWLVVGLIMISALGVGQQFTSVSALAMDKYEPNDSFAEAYTLDSPYDRFSVIYASQEDDDYYRIIENSDDYDYRCEWILDYDPGQNDLWLELYDENETLLETFNNPDATEKGDFIMAFNKTYYFVVKGENLGMPYYLNFGKFRIERVEDEFENYNDDDNLFRVFWIEAGNPPIQPNTTYTNLTLGPDEIDYYAFEANSGDLLNITFETNATADCQVGFAISSDNSWNWNYDLQGTFSFQQVLYFNKHYEQNEYGFWRGDLYYFKLFDDYSISSDEMVHYNMTITLTSPTGTLAENSWVGLEPGESIRGEKTTTYATGGNNEIVDLEFKEFINDSHFLEIRQYHYGGALFAMNQTKTLATENINRACVNTNDVLFPMFYYLEPVAFDFRDHNLNATWESDYTFNGTYEISEEGRKLEVHGRFDEIDSQRYSDVNLTVLYDTRGVLILYEYDYDDFYNGKKRWTYYDDALVVFEDAYEYFDYYCIVPNFDRDLYPPLENGEYTNLVLGGTDFFDRPKIYLHAGSKVTIDITAANSSMNPPLFAQFQYNSFQQIADDVFHLRVTAGILYSREVELIVSALQTEQFTYNITITEHFAKPIEPSPYWFGFGENADLAWTFERDALDREHRIYTIARDIDSLHFENNIAAYMYNETIVGDYYFDFDYRRPREWDGFSYTWLDYEQLSTTGMGQFQYMSTDALSYLAKFPLVNSRYFLFSDEFVDTYYTTMSAIDNVSYTLADGNRTLYLEFDYGGSVWEEDMNGFHQYWVSYSEEGLLESFQFYRYQDDVLLTNRSIALTEATGLIEEVPDDTTPPVITLNSPAEGGTYPQGTAIDFTVEDPYLWRVYARWDDGFESDITGSNVAYLPESPGSHTLYIRAVDMLENEANATFTFIAGTEVAPHIELLSPTPNLVYPALTNITFDVSGPVIDEVYIAWDDGTESLVTDDEYRTVLPETPGEHVLTIRAVSDAGVENFARYTFITEGEVVDDPDDDPDNPDDPTDTTTDTSTGDTNDTATTTDTDTDTDTNPTKETPNPMDSVPGYNFLSVVGFSLVTMLGIIIWRRRRA